MNGGSLCTLFIYNALTVAASFSSTWFLFVYVIDILLQLITIVSTEVRLTTVWCDHISFFLLLVFPKMETQVSFLKCYFPSVNIVLLCPGFLNI